MDTALGTVEGFLHVMSFFLIMTQRLLLTLNENTSTHLSGVSEH